MLKGPRKFGILFVVALLILWRQPAWSEEAVGPAPHSDLDRWISAVQSDSLWIERDQYAHNLWLYVNSNWNRNYSDEDIKKITRLLLDHDDVVVYWAAYSLYLIGPYARAAGATLQQVAHQKDCYFQIHPDELTTQNLPDTLATVMAKLGVTPLPASCEVYDGSPPPPPPHPDLHRFIEAARTPSNMEAGPELYNYVASNLSVKYSHSEIDEIASLLKSDYGPIIYAAVMSLDIIGPDARRVAPVLRTETLHWECYYEKYPVPRTMQTVRFPLEWAMAVLSIERAPLKCGPEEEAWVSSRRPPEYTLPSISDHQASRQ